MRVMIALAKRWSIVYRQNTYIVMDNGRVYITLAPIGDVLITFYAEV
jgi:hypothetical protein